MDGVFQDFSGNCQPCLDLGRLVKYNLELARVHLIFRIALERGVGGTRQSYAALYRWAWPSMYLADTAHPCFKDHSLLATTFR